MNDLSKKVKKLTALILSVCMTATMYGFSGQNRGGVETSQSTTSVDSEPEKYDVSIPEEKENNNASLEKTEEKMSDTSSVTEDIEDSVITEDIEEDDGLSPTTRNSINMLNYMSSLTKRVSDQRKNQLFLESAYEAYDNLYPNSVDTKTQAQITSLMDTIDDYRMISVKRDRIEYIYEKNRAQALRQAIPNPVGLLSVVQSKNLLEAAVSVLYMTFDSVTSYQAATSQADLQFLKDGWELDEAEAKALHNSTKDAFNYMINMVRDYDIPGDYALGKKAIENFVEWSGKPQTERIRKISWLETNQKTYSQFGPYWLELIKDYYDNQEYDKCIEAVRQYESISTRIFRKDIEYATVLPMAILSAKEEMSDKEYVKFAEERCKSIYDNSGDEDWTLRYFVAQIYMDLYALTKADAYLDEAYKMAHENVVVLVDEQKQLNKRYLSKVETTEAKDGANKREKEEVKKYNNTIKAERKVALPPVSEALYLNSDLLFALAEEKKIDNTDKEEIEAILHEDGNSIFLTTALDNRFWFNKPSVDLVIDDDSVTFEGDKLIIPAFCVTDRSIVKVTVSGDNGATFDDWSVVEVKRPKEYTDCSDFKASYKSKTADKHKYKAGDKITVRITPVAESEDKYLEFNFVAKKGSFNKVVFEKEAK